MINETQNVQYEIELFQPSIKGNFVYKKYISEEMASTGSFETMFIEINWGFEKNIESLIQFLKIVPVESISKDNILEFSQVNNGYKHISIDDSSFILKAGQYFENCGLEMGISSIPSKIAKKLMSVNSNFEYQKYISAYKNFDAFFDEENGKQIFPKSEKILCQIDNSIFKSLSFSYNSSLHANDVIEKTASWKKENKQLEMTASEVTSNVPAKNSKLIGFMLKKYTVSNAGVSSLVETLFFENTKRKYHDMQVQYGKVFQYTIQAIWECTNSAGLSFRVASKISNLEKIPAFDVEYQAPVTDINFRFDYLNSSLLLNWASPKDSKQKVAGYQIFKRTSTLEPYTLIHQEIFVKSGQKFLSETVQKQSIAILKNSDMLYSDSTFDITKKNIYAICAIDTHGVTSALSTQYAVSFDKLKSKIVCAQISQSGAPKQYPNLYFTNDLVKDSFIGKLKKDSLKLYFNPDHKFVIDKLGTNYKHIIENGSYLFVATNMNNLKQQTLEVTVSTRIADTESVIEDIEQTAISQDQNLQDVESIILAAIASGNQEELAAALELANTSIKNLQADASKEAANATNKISDILASALEKLLKF